MNAAQELISKAGAALGNLAPQRILQPAGASVLTGLLGLDAIDLVRRAALEDPANFYDQALAKLNLSWECAEKEWKRIPTQGPLIVVSNHPHGLADGLILGSLLSHVRPDVKFLANSILESAAPRGAVIPVNPFEENASVMRNARGLRSALAWLKNCGALVVFPAGEVASLSLHHREVHEPEWRDTAAWLALRTGATVIPAFVYGTNSPAFHLTGLVHPSLRTVLLPRELLNKRGKKIQISFARPVSPSHLSTYSTPRESVRYLQWRSALLRAKGKAAKPPLVSLVRKQTPLAGPADSEAIRAEVEALAENQCLGTHADFSVYFAHTSQIPNTLHEIGRLREVSFRQAGEGTGQPLDLDRFDRHYIHLFLWNHQTEEVIGAYRVALADEVIDRHGLAGLYTNTLFRFDPAFFKSIGPTIELGRSFIRPEYQKAFMPLLMLWRGIGAFVAQRPKYKTLFGAVSISNSYCRESRAILAEFMKRHSWDEHLAGMAKPRGHWNDAPRPHARANSLVTMDHLTDALHDLEPDGKGVPVLLRQYLNLGGKAAAFHRDRSFANALDALLVVELSQAPAKALERYVGKAQAAWYRASKN